ncbi:hypothetical protein [Thermomonas sp. HDW16]|uniref:hypothetical protein n=1 Tax=Thermomonas sp. HDW16 TaxID=2714945 RepID=UPI00140AABC7|nr:hypothetical protein [Thermomonas sp. HDW16]QIL20100.1 hypothetical protein G7079_04755 [Thermomonas sp. HDW16]
MALTLGITGMDSTTEAEVQAAFRAANAELGNTWALAGDESADYVVIDMDSLYGPMSWLRLHAAGRKVIGLTSVDRNQTDYRLPRPVTANDFAVLLSEIAGDAPRATAPEPPPVASTPAPSGQLPPAQAAATVDEIVQTPAEPVARATAVVVEPEPPAPEPEPEPVVELAPDRSLASWLGRNGLERRVRLQRGSDPVLLIDPRSAVWHGPATLKPLTGYFGGTLLIEDFETPDAVAWESEAASLGAAQPLARLQWLGGLLSGHGHLLPGNDVDGNYRLTKWPQTEREYPKHFRIATAMMKGPATIAEVAEASGVAREEVADFVNANLATGYAEFVPPHAPEPETMTPKPTGGLFGRIRGR